MEWRAVSEIARGEGLKTVAEIALSQLSRVALGEQLLAHYAAGAGGRIEDERLRVAVAGVEFENPVLVGAGWDKKGRAIRGLHALGFAGVEVGTVLPFPQPGNPRPRLWTIDGAQHSVGFNRLGYNSPGAEAVGRYLTSFASDDFPIGLNVGKNKLLPNNQAPWAHAHVIEQLGAHASYVVLGISSPNTTDLRGLQDKAPLRDNLQAAQGAISNLGKPVPLFVKIDPERTPQELDDIIEVIVEENAAGVVATNTYSGSDLKAIYGVRWTHQDGGLSGADPGFRKRAIATVRYMYENAGDRLAIIGAGGIDSAATALNMMRAGASAVQVVTAMRPSRGKVAAQINKGFLAHLNQEGIGSLKELVGAGTQRGPRT